MNVRTNPTENYDIETGERLNLSQLDTYIKIKSEKNVKNYRETKTITWFTYWKKTKNEPSKQGTLF